MIGIKLTGGLGNNMFEYASAKSLAVSKKTKLCFFSQKDLKFNLKKFKKFLLFCFYGKKDSLKKQLSERTLNKYFKIDENFLKLFLYRLIWLFKSNKKKYKYTYKKVFVNNVSSKYIREEFYNCPDWTQLEGGFLSEEFFAERKKILKWFTPRDFYKKKIDKIEKTFNLPIQKRCCVHIRRGDALYMDKGSAYRGLGWSLPEEYYNFIFKKLPKDLLYIFVSDEPNWAMNKFDYLPNKIFLKNNSELVDMFIFSKCKYNVISRGTFSWWGAWLNQIPNKIVYAPKYFIGIPQKRCIPFGMDKGLEVSKWNFIDLEIDCFKKNL